MATTPTAVEEKIHSLGLELPEAPISKGAFDQCQIVGNIVDTGLELTGGIAVN